MSFDALDEPTLFDWEKPPPVSLADHFVVPPLSILDQRSGLWQDRKARWLSLGLDSGLGRDDALVGASKSGFLPDYYKQKRAAEAALGRTISNAEFEAEWMVVPDVANVGTTGTSVFDPVLAELGYRWFSHVGDRVLDPFAGGSVRGIVASILGRAYVGIDLRPEQVAANVDQLGLAGDPPPRWVVGDARDIVQLTDGRPVDLILSCPPYADLEVYSDDPRDLSTMRYPDFLREYRRSIEAAASLLRRDRFAFWVVSDVRGSDGFYHGLVGDTVDAFRDCGLRLHNDFVLVEMVGAKAIRAKRAFDGTRTAQRSHQHALVFVKGDRKAAAAHAIGGGA